MSSSITSESSATHTTHTTMSSPPIYGHDGIYRSPRPPISIPRDPNFSLIPFLFRKLSSISDHPAVVDAETAETLTFSDLKTHVLKLSHALTNLSIHKNDVVLILSPNSIFFPVAFFAVVAAGAVATTANPQYTTAELAKQIKDSKPKLIITTHQLYHMIEQFDLPYLLLDPQPIESSTAVDASRFVPVSRLHTDAAAILYSSGTTGTSKGVVLTHRNFIAAALMATADQDYYKESGIVFLCFLPMFHVFGLSALLCAQLQRGNTVVVMERFDLKKMLAAIEKYKVTHSFAVPPVIIALAKNQDLVKRFDVSSLRKIGSGAAPLGKEVIDECAKIFTQASILQGYGMTETCASISSEDPKRGSHISGSTGFLDASVEARIMNLETLQPLPPLQNGEIWVRGPNIMEGYYKNRKATMETIDDQGWLHTGDLGYFDGEGRLYVVDRIKELIKCKGFQVAPADLEELLLAHPEIVDAAVIGLPDDEAGEVPIAYIVRSSVSSLTAEEIKQFIAKQVAPYKRLRRVILTDAIPKSAAGKILRRELRHKATSKL